MADPVALVTQLAGSIDPEQQALSAYFAGLLAEREGQDLPASASMVFQAYRVLLHRPPSVDQRYLLHRVCVDALRFAFLLPRLDLADELGATSARLFSLAPVEAGQVTWRALCLLHQAMVSQYLLGDAGAAVALYQEAGALMDSALFDPFYLPRRLELWLHQGTCHLARGEVASAAALLERLEGKAGMPAQPGWTAALAGRLHLWQSRAARRQGDRAMADWHLEQAEQAAGRLQMAAAGAAAPEQGFWLVESQVYCWCAALAGPGQEQAAAGRCEVARQARRHGQTWLWQWHVAQETGAGLRQGGPIGA